MCQRVYECFDLFFKFCTDREKNEQAEKKTVMMVLLKLLFFTGFLLLLLFLCRYRTFFFPHVFVLRETSNTSEKHKCQEERGGEDGQISLLSLLLREEFGQIFL